MSSFTVSGVPAFAWLIGFAVVATLPVWAAAKLVGIENCSLIRCGTSLIAGAVASAIVTAVLGGIGILLVPIAFLVSFKFILETSFFRALIICIIVTLGYISLFSNIMSGFKFTP